MRRLGLIAVVIALLALGGSVYAQAVQNVEVHGYMLNRFYDNPSASARFIIERVSLSAVGKLGDDGTGYIEVYLHPYLTDQVVPGLYGGTVTADEFRTYLESAYVDLPLGSGRIRVGKGRQLNFGMTPTNPNRKTTQYGILSETFTQDRIVGAQFTMKKRALDGGITVFTDQPLGQRKIGDFGGDYPADIVPHWVDKDVPGAISGELAVTGRFGITKPCFQFHASVDRGGLNRNQTAAIQTAFNGPVGVTSHSKFGFDSAWTRGPVVAQGEWYAGQFSFNRIAGYSLLLGYQPKDKRRAYVRYAALNNEWAPTASPASWDVQQLTFGLVQPIRKGVWAELDWEKNMESPPAGVSQIANDLLFVEFFTGF